MRTLRKATFHGPIEAVVFDWAGTTLDYGCCAPAGVFVEAFRRHGLSITLELARGPMGTHKLYHIQTLCAEPTVREQWRTLHGRDFTEQDIRAIYDEFVPLTVEVLPSYAELVPGVLPVVAELRKRGVKIGSCTGYVQEMMAVLTPIASEQGYTPDCMVCADEVAEGRPSPLMLYANMIRLGVWLPEAVLKVGDTVSDIHEGRNAGAWTVGVTISGNEVGLPLAELQALPAAELAERKRIAAERLREAGAHFVIDSVADLLPVLDEVNRRLATGEKP